MTGNILLYSSGVDSYIAKDFLIKERKIRDLISVYINLEHRYSNIEMKYIRAYNPNTILLKFSDYGKLFEKYDAYIPNRNLLFCIIVASYFEDAYDKINIFLGGLKDDRIHDNNQKAFDEFSKTISLSSQKEIKIFSAFDFKLSKKEIVDWWYDNQKDGVCLSQTTFSCYNPSETRRDPHCYACRACFRRNVALLDYKFIDFKDHELLHFYYKELKRNRDNYDKIRYEQTVRYIQKCLGLTT